MEIEMFLKENHPEILEQYQMFQRREELPKIGATIRTSRGGFGSSMGGRILKVVGYGHEGEKSSGNAVWGGNYIVLRGRNRDDEYLSSKDTWWKDFYIEKE